MARRLSTPSADGCPAVHEVVDRVGSKWSVFVVALLGDGAKRFTTLKRAIKGISQRMLTITLRTLERDGVVTRTIHPTIPPRVDYALTALGKTLVAPVLALATWAGEHRVEISEARGRYDGSHVAVAGGLPPTPGDPVLEKPVSGVTLLD
jgi:DNA-binding HxlR family transcriptional regulator